MKKPIADHLPSSEPLLQLKSLDSKVESGNLNGYVIARMSTTPKPMTPLGRTSAWIRENALLLSTVSGVLFGVIFGVSLRPLNLDDQSVMLISYPGELFLRLLKLMILPLIIASLIAGSSSLNARLSGKIAARTLVYFLVTSLLNAALGVLLVVLIHPGNPETKSLLGSGTESRKASMMDNILDLGRNIFPDNLFQAAFQQTQTIVVPKKIVIFNSSGNSVESMDPQMNTTTISMVRQLTYREGTNTLGIIFFCLVFGSVLGGLGKKARVVIDFFTVIDQAVMKMVTNIMWITPLGVCSVICGRILASGDLGLMAEQLGLFVFTVVFGVLLYQLIIMQLIYFLFTRRNPFRLYVALLQSWITAFATASTAAALPVTFRCMDEKVKADRRISRFVLPIGATVNMDGTALFVSVASIFIAQMNEIELGFGELVTVVLTSTAASIASASVPSAALVLMLIVLSAIDAPAQDVSLLFAVDWFVDRVRTTNNMLGDCYAAVIVEYLSKAELRAMDEQAAEALKKEKKENVSNGHALVSTDDQLSDVEPDVVITQCGPMLKESTMTAM